MWDMGVGTGAQAALWELELHLLGESLGKKGDRVTALRDQTESGAPHAMRAGGGRS